MHEKYKLHWSQWKVFLVLSYYPVGMAGQWSPLQRAALYNTMMRI